MNEYTCQIRGKTFRDLDASYVSTEACKAKDAEEALDKFKKLAKKWNNYWEIRDFRKL